VRLGRVGVQVIALLLVASLAHAQPDHIILARVAVHESGWESPADVALIHQVIQGIATRDGVTFRRAASLASPRLARCEVRRRWVCGLGEAGERPRGFPGRWSRYRDRWLVLLGVARRALAGEVVSGPCAERPRVWGSREDVRRGRARGRRWIDARCPGARNLGGRWL